MVLQFDHTNRKHKMDYNCTDCNGTGADQKKTADARRKGQCDRGSYISCWTCNGNGLDPAKYFRWSDAQSPGQQPVSPPLSQ